MKNTSSTTTASSASLFPPLADKRRKVTVPRSRATVYVFGQQTSGKSYIVHALNDNKIDARSCDEHSGVVVRLKPGDVVVYTVLHNGNSTTFFKVADLLDTTDVDGSEAWSCHQIIVEPAESKNFKPALSRCVKELRTILDQPLVYYVSDKNGEVVDVD